MARRKLRLNKEQTTSWHDVLNKIRLALSQPHNLYVVFIFRLCQMQIDTCVLGNKDFRIEC